MLVKFLGGNNFESDSEKTFAFKCCSWRNDAISDKGLVYAEEIDVVPENPSNNTVEAN